ncbi:hypothetical protein DYH09_12695 [bacterium CPR1]|nr:hypothetical protein [bacterium CPR1]
MRRWISCLALVLGLVLVAGPAWGEQVYIRNKPFKGAVSGKGPATAVELQALVAALGFQLTEVQGNWVVTAEGETAALPTDASGTGQVYYQGKPIATADQAGATLVPLIPTAQALGAVARHNKDMGSIDVNLPVKSVSSTGSSPASSGGGTRLINFWASW